MHERQDAERLVAERARARTERDFARADALRDEIAALGFDVEDGPAGTTLVERSSGEPDPLDDVLRDDPTTAVSVHVLYEGFRDDLVRFVEGLRSDVAHEIAVTEIGSPDAAWLESTADERMRILHLDANVGWAKARDVAARTSRGGVVVIADLSVEPHGDVLTPVVAALEDPSVGVAGPWGLVTDDMRTFHEAIGPEVHAIEGYFLGMRRDVYARAPLDPWFRWYRHADLDLSFRVRSLGLRAVVAPIPAQRHEHRGWAAVSEPERSARSRKNFYRFLDRWKDRTDLLDVSDR